MTNAEYCSLSEMTKTVRWLKIVVVVLSILTIGFLIGLIILSQRKISNDGEPSSPPSFSEIHSKNCPSVYKVDTSLPKDPGVFQPLSEGEIHAVRDYLLGIPSLNLTRYENASLTDNYIYAIDIYLPDKSDVLKHLDKGGPKPVRRAHAILSNGAKQAQDIEEYIVEPLPKPRKHSSLRQNGRTSTIPFNARPNGAKEFHSIFQIVYQYFPYLDLIFKESFGYNFLNCSNTCVTPFPSGLVGTVTPGNRITWFGFQRNEPGQYLHVFPIEIMFNHSDKDPKKWFMGKVRIRILQKIGTRTKTSDTLTLTPTTSLIDDI